jgi:uncharacterized Zn-binding protein involved in type VI secretion
MAFIQQMSEGTLVAARVGDMHTCPMSEPGPVPHTGGCVHVGSSNVFVENSPAARLGDACVCTGPSDAIAKASASVFINGLAAARIGDATVHGGVIVGGAMKTFIGDGVPPESACMIEAAKTGAATIS